MRVMGSLSFLAVFLVTVTASADQEVIKDENGKTLALVYDCSSCESPKEGEPCAQGLEQGFHDGKRCGQCLLEANFGSRIAYGYDLVFRGYLKDEKGEPIVGRYVRVLLPNTWRYSTRTLKDGFFQLSLGASADREGESLLIDLGVRRIPSADKREYLMFLLPPDHKPCEKEGS